MSWRDLKPLDDRYEMERPFIDQSGRPKEHISQVTLTFADPVSADWFAEWLRSRQGWTAFTAWVDEKR